MPTETNVQLLFRTTNGAQAFALKRAGFPPLAKWNEYSTQQLDGLGCGATEAVQRGIPGTISYFFERSEELDECVRAFDETCDRIEERMKDEGGRMKSEAPPLQPSTFNLPPSPPPGNELIYAFNRAWHQLEEGLDAELTTDIPAPDIVRLIALILKLRQTRGDHWQKWHTQLTPAAAGITGTEIPLTDCFRILACTLKLRKTWAEAWKGWVPMITTRNPGEPKRIDEPDGKGFRVDYPGFKTISANAIP